MSMLSPELVNRLEKFLSENEMLGEPATSEQIAEAEALLFVKFSDDYVDFITRFGGAYAGVDIHAFDSPESVVVLTKWMREAYGNGDVRQEEALQSYAISDDGSGNTILINQHGEVVIYYHDCDERKVLASSLGAFIEANFEEW